ncbi:hypothetical protein J6590_058259 [Homalodisca vitripennis]|nr:hypothetical protein J6590_058259 [Homalodisca vitripennis]
MECVFFCCSPPIIQKAVHEYTRYSPSPSNQPALLPKPQSNQVGNLRCQHIPHSARGDIWGRGSLRQRGNMGRHPVSGVECTVLLDGTADSTNEETGVEAQAGGVAGNAADRWVGGDKDKIHMVTGWSLDVRRWTTLVE